LYIGNRIESNSIFELIDFIGRTVLEKAIDKVGIADY